MRTGCAGAIGTAEFAGARLCDVLAYAGLSYEDGFGEARLFSLTSKQCL